MCGEKCPPFCRICNDDQFKGDENTLSELFLGQEDETDAHYVCLVDCNHYFEVNVSIIFLLLGYILETNSFEFVRILIVGLLKKVA